MKIHHLALRVGDCERSARFYSDVLQLPEIRRQAAPGGGLRAIWLGIGEAVLMLERSLRGAGESGGSGHLLALAVDDLAFWEERLRERGIAIEDRTEYTLYLSDPDGHRLGLTIYPLSDARPRAASD